MYTHTSLSLYIYIYIHINVQEHAPVPEAGDPAVYYTTIYYAT